MDNNRFKNFTGHAMKPLQNLRRILVSTLLFGLLPLAVFAQNDLQYMRPYSKDGIDVFEPSKKDTVQYEGFKVRIGGAFTQQWQSLIQSTKGIDPTTGTTFALANIGPGFNLAEANLNIDAQLADGVRLHMVTYLSTQHHTDTWVKGGYLQVDKLPMFHSEEIDNIMQYLRFKVGHMEINYGDGHFRRTDAGNAMYNPFIGNYLMDAFTTEVGGEAYLMNSGAIAMLGVTGGQLHPSVLNPDSRAPSIYGKIGYDNHAGNDAFRFRLTGSIYHNNYYTNLYNGDRAGSRYYNVMANDAWAGRVVPAFTNGFTSIMINPYIKYQGLEIFGLYENANEMKTSQKVNQYSIEGVYRFGSYENLYIGARYNVVKGDLVANTNVTVERTQISAGWFMTKNVLAKIGYTYQTYKDYPLNNLYHGAKFHGVTIEAVLGF